MSRQRFIALAIAAVLAISGALYLSTQRNLPKDPHGIALLPSLAGELNTVTAVSLRRASAAPTVTLHERDGRWTVAERGDYPADVPKLRKLLLSLSDAKIVEEKTSNPAYFPVIGVDDPSAPGATGAEVVVTARDGKHALIVGKATGEGNFVRRIGDGKSYSVEPAISFETDPRFWIESKLIDIPATDIQRLEVKPAAGPAYTVRRETAGASSTSGASNYALDGVPPGRKASDSATLAPSPTAYNGLTADDVTPLAAVDFSRATVATLTMSDGNVITLSGVVAGDKHWLSPQSSKDTALNEKTSGRAFDIASYRFDAIFRPLEQLLVPKPAPAAKAPPAKAPSADKAPTGANKAPSAKKPAPAPTP